MRERPQTPDADEADSPAAPTRSGTIVRLLTEKGFGFITGDDGREYFLHPSELMDCDFAQLRIGETVTFTPLNNAPKGWRAQAIRRHP